MPGGVAVTAMLRLTLEARCSSQPSRQSQPCLNTPNPTTHACIENPKDF